MQILVLRSNNLEGEIPIQIRYLHKLQILDPAMNRLSGSIPPYLSNLSTLTLSSEDITSSLSTVLKYGNYYKEEVTLMIKGQIMAYKYILSAVTSLDLSANSHFIYIIYALISFLNLKLKMKDRKKIKKKRSLS